VNEEDSGVRRRRTDDDRDRKACQDRGQRLEQQSERAHEDKPKHG
jgi:hypothetical protein